MNSQDKQTPKSGEDYVFLMLMTRKNPVRAHLIPPTILCGDRHFLVTRTDNDFFANTAGESKRISLLAAGLSLDTVPSDRIRNLSGLL